MRTEVSPSEYDRLLPMVIADPAAQLEKLAADYRAAEAAAETENNPLGRLAYAKLVAHEKLVVATYAAVGSQVFHPAFWSIGRRGCEPWKEGLDLAALVLKGGPAALAPRATGTQAARLLAVAA